jgi:hypothetical protein
VEKKSEKFSSSVAVYFKKKKFSLFLIPYENDICIIYQEFDSEEDQSASRDSNNENSEVKLFLHKEISNIYILQIILLNV